MHRVVTRRWGQRITYAMLHAHEKPTRQSLVQGVGATSAICISIQSVVVKRSSSVCDYFRDGHCVLILQAGVQ